MHTSMHSYVRIYMYLYIYAFIHLYLHSCTSKLMYFYISTFAYLYVHAHVFCCISIVLIIFTHSYVLTFLHVYSFYIHTCTCCCISAFWHADFCIYVFLHFCISAFVACTNLLPVPAASGRQPRQAAASCRSAVLYPKKHNALIFICIYAHIYMSIYAYLHSGGGGGLTGQDRAMTMQPLRCRRKIHRGHLQRGLHIRPLRGLHLHAAAVCVYNASCCETWRRPCMSRQLLQLYVNADGVLPSGLEQKWLWSAF